MSRVTPAGELSSTVWSCKDSSVRFTARLCPSLKLSTLNKDAIRPYLSLWPPKHNHSVRQCVRRDFCRLLPATTAKSVCKCPRVYRAIGGQIARRQACPTGQVASPKSSRAWACLSRRRPDAFPIMICTRGTGTPTLSPERSTMSPSLEEYVWCCENCGSVVRAKE